MSKNIIEKIKKLAQEVDPVPTSSKQNRSVEFGPPAPAKNRPISYSVPAVKELQKTIIEFANVASDTDVTSLPGTYSPQQYGKQTREIPGEIGEAREEKTEYLGGSNPFGNFLVNNYIPKDSFTGRQYLNVDVYGQKERALQSHQPMNLRGVIDSIKRIGSPDTKGTEKAPDGIWQSRTNNALHIIADVATAMFNFANDLGIKNLEYSEKDLQNYKSLIPASYTELKSQEEIKEKATQLTAEIIKITNFFQKLKTTVFENKTLRKYIDQKKPFATYQQATKIDKSLNLNYPIPGVKFPDNFTTDKENNYITLKDLSNLDNFKLFIKRVDPGMNSEDPETIKKIFNIVSGTINPSEKFGF